MSNDATKPKSDYLSVLAQFKNETMNLRVWIEHYLWQGVDHFYLIDNDSNDRPLDILQDYMDQGIVSYYFMPEPQSQVPNYETIFVRERLRDATEWLIVCDLDEFFFGTETTLRRVLRSMPASCRVIDSQWYNYGHDDRQAHPDDIRTGNLHRDPDLKNTKTIFRTDVITRKDMVNIHYLHNYDGPVTRENTRIRLHHYRLQSYEYFQRVKMARGDACYTTNNRTDDYFHQENKVCTLYDDTLKQLVDKYQDVEYDVRPPTDRNRNEDGDHFAVGTEGAYGSWSNSWWSSNITWTMATAFVGCLAVVMVSSWYTLALTKNIRVRSHKKKM